MKSKKITLALSVLATLVASAAYADVIMSSGPNANSATGSPDGSATPTESGGTSAIYKLAILGGQEEAVGVLNGAQGGDLFERAREAAEQMTQVRFATDRDAALAVIELGEQMQ